MQLFSTQRITRDVGEVEVFLCVQNRLEKAILVPLVGTDVAWEAFRLAQIDAVSTVGYRELARSETGDENHFERNPCHRNERRDHDALQERMSAAVPD